MWFEHFQDLIFVGSSSLSSGISFINSTFFMLNLIYELVWLHARVRIMIRRLELIFQGVKKSDFYF